MIKYHLFSGLLTLIGCGTILFILMKSNRGKVMLWDEKELMNYTSKKGIDNGKSVFHFLLVFILTFLGFIKN